MIITTLPSTTTTTTTTYEYSYYPETTTRYYKPLTLYYNYYYPLRSLNHYSSYWPNYYYWPSTYTYYWPRSYNYWKYLSWPSDKFWYLKTVSDCFTPISSVPFAVSNASSNRSLSLLSQRTEEWVAPFDTHRYVLRSNQTWSIFSCSTMRLVWFVPNQLRSWNGFTLRFRVCRNCSPSRVTGNWVTVDKYATVAHNRPFSHSGMKNCCRHVWPTTTTSTECWWRRPKTRGSSTPLTGPNRHESTSVRSSIDICGNGRAFTFHPFIMFRSGTPVVRVVRRKPRLSSQEERVAVRGSSEKRHSTAQLLHRKVQTGKGIGQNKGDQRR